MRGIVYTRVSSDEQVAGTSLASQDELCRRYCEQRGIEVMEVFREEGETAKDLALNNRKRFLAALEFCRRAKPKIDAFVVYRVDRFARNADDHFAVRRILLSYGTTLSSVTEPIGNRPAEKFIETVLAGAAEYDNALRKQRCTEGMIARIKQGIWPFKPPVGYVCARHRLRGEKKTKPDEPDGEVFALVQKALLAYSVGEVPSQTALALQMNAWGFERLTGRRATKQLVDRLLGGLLPFYAGLVRNPWTGEEHDGLHVPMISREEMHRIRLRRFGHAPRRAPATRTHFNLAFPLRRLLRCRECGRFVTACNSAGNGGTYGYYYCVNRTCPLRSRSLRSSVVHPMFSALLAKLTAAPSALDAIELKLRERWTKQREATSTTQQSHADRLGALSERRRRIFEMREDGSYDLSTFKERLRSVDADIASLAPPATARSIADLDIEALTLAARWLLAQLSEVWRQATTPATRLRFERLAFPRGIRPDADGTIRTVIPGLLFAISGHVDASLSLEVDPVGLNSNQEEHGYFSDLIELHRELQRLAGTTATEATTNARHAA